MCDEHYITDAQEIPSYAEDIDEWHRIVPSVSEEIDVSEELRDVSEESTEDDVPLHTRGVSIDDDIGYIDSIIEEILE